MARRFRLPVVLLALIAAPALVRVAPQAPLVHRNDLAYLGAFRVPTQADLRFDHSGHGLTYDAQRDSLFVSNHASRVSEISIPAPGTGPLGSLPRAALLQGPTDVLRGRLSQAGDMIGGLLVDGQDLIVSAYVLYDVQGANVNGSHFRVPKDFSRSSVVGPLRLGLLGAGYVGGPMARVPPGWEALLGGPALTGLCCVSIISRSSYGPTATVFNPDDVRASATQVPGTVVLVYPSTHPTLGDWNSSGTLWNNASAPGGMVFVEGTDSVLYIGRKGDRYCYGSGERCGDPTSPHQGDHAYPYEYHVWAYGAHDLLAAGRREVQPWDVRPYATWTFEMPLASGGRGIRGVAYDPGTQRVFLAEQQADGASVLIRVLQVTNALPPDEAAKAAALAAARAALRAAAGASGGVFGAAFLGAVKAWLAAGRRGR